MGDKRFIPGFIPSGTEAELPQRQPYMVTPSGMGTKALAALGSTRDTKSNKLSGTSRIEAMGVTFTRSALASASLSLGVNAHKLESVAANTFLYLNNDNANPSAKDLVVRFSLFEYAKWLGYDVEERVTDTEEAARRERKRVKIAMDAAAREVKKTLASLAAGTLTWKEKVKGKHDEFLNVKIIGTHGIVDGYVYVTFDPVYAAYLLAVPKTHYAIPLLGIPATQPNAYIMGMKITEHYSIYENHTKGTADRLAVRSLLSCTKLPSFEEVKAKRKSWIERIKEPFEAALDVLKDRNVIEEWRYVLPGNREIQDDDYETLDTLMDYAVWENVLVRFKLKDPPDLSEAIKAYSEKKEKTKAKKEKIAREAQTRALTKKLQAGQEEPQ